ncbi:histidine kinase [Actinoplanes sp. NPDC048967]|uniref:sensor histidine kinase n=1 Tax=Actinoplanes sp. NPDC048967 TaxID=3155269 RepID=UPI0033CC6710
MHRQMRRARVVTLVVLATNGSMALFLPAVGLWREPETFRIFLGAIGILLFSVAQGFVLHALVTPWLSPRARRGALLGLATASVASVPLVGPTGGTWPSWAWLAACIIGVLPVITGRWTALALSAVTAAVAVLTTPGSVRDALIISVGFGAGIAAINAVQVWFWELLMQAEQGRAAQSQLAAGEERLRFARDVHDSLGHHLSVIALKAELAERLAPVDPPRAAREAAEVRGLATSALTELREVVHGYRQVDLREQLTAIEQVLVSSGVRCTVQAPDGVLPPPVSAPLAAVLREASTNVLRHSRAAWCTIDIVRVGPEFMMTVVNDGAGDAAPDRHSHGLHGLAERLAESGGVLRTRAADGRFTVEAVVRSAP